MHWKNLRYILLHKWFVMIECFRYRLIWRGLTHDLTKFSLREWTPYARYFFAHKLQGMHRPGSDPEFDLAWLQHQNRNDHHWQYWRALTDRYHKTLYFPMSPAARLEMVCDWIAAGKAQGNKGDGKLPEVVTWWKAHQWGIELHPATRRWVNTFMRYLSAKHTLRGI